MNDFYFQLPTEVFFGKGQIKNLGPSICKYGKRVLLVYGGGSIKRIGLYDEVRAIFSNEGITAAELSGVEPNPKIDTVRKGVALCREHSIEVILAVGGGSAIDCAKLISAAVSYAGDPWEMVLNPSLITQTLPLITVLTLAATGSEMDRFAVISNPQTNDKIGVFCPLLHPKASILDPTYTFTVPGNQTAAGTVDIMSHIMEKYFSRTEGAFLQRRMAEALLKTCIHFGPIAYREPENYDARANLMWASSLGVDAIVWRGSDVTNSIHPMEHELSAYYDITHGVGLAILTPNWMRYALREETVGRFVEYGVNVWGIDPALAPFEIANRAIDALQAFYRSLGVPTTLTEVGIDSTHFAIMAEKAVRRMAGAFVPVTPSDIEAIFQASL